MPTPPKFLKGQHDPGVTNIRNAASPHWRRWLGQTSRCLVPATSFSEYGKVRDPETKKLPLHWFALDGTQPLFCFAGIWTRWHGKRKAKEEPADHESFAFLTTQPNAVVRPIHEKAMPVALTEPEEMDLWLEAPWKEAKALQRPLRVRLRMFSMADAAQEEASHGDVDHGLGDVDALLVVADEPPPARHPGEGPLDDPSPRQHEA